MSPGCTRGSCACSREIIRLTGKQKPQLQPEKEEGNQLGRSHPSAPLPFPTERLPLPWHPRQQLFRWPFWLPEVPGSKKAAA